MKFTQKNTTNTCIVDHAGLFAATGQQYNLPKHDLPAFTPTGTISSTRSSSSSIGSDMQPFDIISIIDDALALIDSDEADPSKSE